MARRMAWPGLNPHSVPQEPREAHTVVTPWIEGAANWDIGLGQWAEAKGYWTV